MLIRQINPLPLDPIERIGPGTGRIDKDLVNDLIEGGVPEAEVIRDIAEVAHLVKEAALLVATGKKSRKKRVKSNSFHIGPTLDGIALQTILWNSASVCVSTIGKGQHHWIAWKSFDYTLIDLGVIKDLAAQADSQNSRKRSA